jgi:competence protein ComEA
MKFLALIAMMVTFVFASVDINSASVKELTTIKGIGSKKAQAIVKYRKQHCFKSVDEIVKVKGLGKKFLQKNKKNLKAGKCKK